MTKLDLRAAAKAGAMMAMLAASLLAGGVLRASPNVETERCKNPPAKTDADWRSFAKKLAGGKGCVTPGERNQYELVTGCKYPIDDARYPRRCEGQGDRPSWK